MTGDRGQLVVLAAAALAVALAPMALAYLQLGYGDDVGAAAVSDSPARNAERLLIRATVDALEGIDGTYRWSARDGAVERLRERLRPSLRTLNRSQVVSGTVYAVTYNATATRVWMRANCPDGPDRQFGSCRSIDGVAVQERAGRTHVLGIAFDVRATTPGSEWALTTVIQGQ